MCVCISCRLHPSLKREGNIATIPSECIVIVEVVATSSHTATKDCPKGDHYRQVPLYFYLSIVGLIGSRNGSVFVLEVLWLPGVCGNSWPLVSLYCWHGEPCIEAREDSY